MSYFAGSGARPVTVTADGVVSDKPCRLVGVLMTHTATTTAILYDNASAASGTKLGTFGVAANDQSFVHFGDEGVECVNGVYADWTAGVVTVYIKK